MTRPLAALLLVAALALAGCGGGGGSPPPRFPPVRLAGLLPTPPGLRDETPAHAVDAAGLERALFGRAAGRAADLIEQGLKRAAVRTWTGANGRRMTVAVSEWDDHLPATTVGAGAAEAPLGSPGARAWTPAAVGGTRGSQVGPPGPSSQALSIAVDTTGLFVRSEGPVPADVVIRTMRRLIAALGAGPPP